VRAFLQTVSCQRDETPPPKKEDIQMTKAASVTIIETTAPATIYLPGGFGYKATEVRSLRVEVAPYAQYAAVYKVTYVEKGKRKPTSYALTSNPRGLIVEGHGHPKMRSPMDSTGDGNTMTRHSCFAPEWDGEFQSFAAENLSAARVLLDISKTPAKTAAESAQGAA
jgi:hypothetical protein